MPEPEDTIPHHLEVIFAGDIMGHDAQIASAYDSLTKTYNYDTVFKFISPYILQADLAIANFEVTLAGPIKVIHNSPVRMNLQLPRRTQVLIYWPTPTITLWMGEPKD